MLELRKLHLHINKILVEYTTKADEQGVSIEIISCVKWASRQIGLTTEP